MKKLLFVFVLVAIICSAVCADNNLIIKNGVLLGHNGKKENITIPNGVKEIAEYWNDGEIKTLNVPATVTKIYSYSLLYCDKVNINKNNKHYCSVNGAVYTKDMSTLIYVSYNDKKIFEVPATVTKIDSYALKGQKKVNVNKNNKHYASVDGVVYSKDTFRLIHIPSNYKYKTFDVPNKVKSIESDAFHNIYSIKILNIPSTFKEIEIYSNARFELMPLELEAINVNKDNTVYSSENGVLFDKEKTKLIWYPSHKKDTSYTIPKTVRYIAPYAFYMNEYLKELHIGKNVKRIGENAFCFNNLEDVYVENKYIIFDNSATPNFGTNSEDQEIHMHRL